MGLSDRIQNVINSLDQGVGLVVLRTVLCALLALALLWGYAYSQFRGLREAEAMEVAHLAHRLAVGKGFTTQCLRPVDLWALDNSAVDTPGTDEFPDLRHPPAFPALLSLGFRILAPSFEVSPGLDIFEPERRVIVPFGIVLTMLTGLFVFLLGRRLFDTRVGAIAALLFFLTHSILADSISGTPAPMIMLLTTGAAYAAVCAVSRKHEGGSMLSWGLPFCAAAVLCGLAALTGYVMLVLAIPMGLFAATAFQRRRAAVLVVFVLVAAAVVSPWLIRNRSVAREMLGLTTCAVVRDSPLYEGDTLDRATEPDLGHGRVVRAATAKLLRGLARLYDVNLRTLGSGIVICFFLVSYFCRFEQDTADQFRWFLGLGILLLLVGTAVGPGPSSRALNAFLPLIILYGAAYFLATAERAANYDSAAQTVLVWLMVLLTALPATLQVMDRRPASPYPPYFPPFISYVCDLLEPHEAVCTDIPWAAAWYGNRTAILLPQDVEDLEKLHKDRRPIHALYVTTRTGDKPFTSSLASGKERSWLPILNRSVPEDFPWPHGIAFPPGTRDQIFLTDRVRWTPTATNVLAEERQDGLEIRPTK